MFKTKLNANWEEDRAKNKKKSVKDTFVKPLCLKFALYGNSGLDWENKRENEK